MVKSTKLADDGVTFSKYKKNNFKWERKQRFGQLVNSGCGREHDRERGRECRCGCECGRGRGVGAVVGVDPVISLSFRSRLISAASFRL